MGNILVCVNVHATWSRMMLCVREWALLMKSCRKSRAVSDVVCDEMCVWEVITVLSEIHNYQELRGEEFEGERENNEYARHVFSLPGGGGGQGLSTSAARLDDETTERKRIKRNIWTGNNSATPFLTLGLKEKQRHPCADLNTSHCLNYFRREHEDMLCSILAIFDLDFYDYDVFHTSL